MDEEAVARRRAWQLDGQADELCAAARRLRMVASQVTGPLQQVEDRLGLSVWEGNAATQARDALAVRQRQSRELARRLESLADQAQHAAHQLQGEADQLRRGLGH